MFRVVVAVNHVNKIFSGSHKRRNQIRTDNRTQGFRPKRERERDGRKGHTRQCVADDNPNCLRYHTHCEFFIIRFVSCEDSLGERRPPRCFENFNRKINWKILLFLTCSFTVFCPPSTSPCVWVRTGGAEGVIKVGRGRGKVYNTQISCSESLLEAFSLVFSRPLRLFFSFQNLHAIQLLAATKWRSKHENRKDSGKNWK